MHTLAIPSTDINLIKKKLKNSYISISEEDNNLDKSARYMLSSEGKLIRGIIAYKISIISLIKKSIAIEINEPQQYF